MRLKVHDPSGLIIAEVFDSAAGALLMSLYGDGSHITYRNRVVWREGIDGEGAESYDTTHIKMMERINNRRGVRVDA